MIFYLSLPLIFLKFWYIEAPIGLIKFFGSLNAAFLHLFSLPLFIHTFFKPLKNEYREGLVWFSIGMGIFVKTILILVDAILFIGLAAIEAMVFFLFLLWPIFTIFLLSLSFLFGRITIFNFHP